ncbi:MAG: TonB-dependent receptor [Verrucomicrobia bacterium]|nr:MAG: TonB-dependent receptor [Verrucomicrobiota bacterium]
MPCPGNVRPQFAIVGTFIATLLSSLCTLVAQTEATNELEKSVQQLKGLQLEELVSLQVSALSRRPERLLDSPSAAQVATGEDIRRSAATSLPEALRLFPNLQVDQVDSQQWAISARGFNSTAADKLQVMIDGRSVYTPLFSGVFWDVQNVMLEDLDRIEVISGPGASLWGANSMNGVINVVSKSAQDTQGLLVSGGGGSFVNGAGAVRYGDKLGQDLYFRVYGFGFDRDNTLLPNGRDATNDWYMVQGGFRMDWLPGQTENSGQGDHITVQGDFYGGSLQQPIFSDSTVQGQNILSRWTHPITEESVTTLQLYWDRTWRDVPGSYTEELNTFDLDFQHRFRLAQRHEVIWGLGYRLMADDVGNTPVLAFLPAHRNLQLFSGFVQDEIALIPETLSLTIGTKLEHNDYSGFEAQPTGRITWKPDTNQTVWAAISRAVRSPSRIDTDFFVPGQPPYLLVGAGRRFESETLIAYELGYRRQVTERLSGSLSLFFNDYDHIRSVEPVAGATNQFIILNQLRAQSYGAELSLTWQMLDWWRMRGGYTYFHKDVYTDESRDVNHGTGEGNDPHHWFVVQSMMDLPANFEFDSVLRYQDNLNQLGPTVPAYLALDLRLGWHATRNLELSIAGQNILDPQHPEFGAPATRQEIPRSVFGKVTWRF